MNADGRPNVAEDVELMSVPAPEPKPTLIPISHAEVMAVKDARRHGRPASVEVAGPVRDHSQAVRDILRRAGMSEASELTLEEVKRAREAVHVYRYKRAKAETIRRHIIPRTEEEA